MGAKEKLIEKAQNFAMKGALDKAIAEYSAALELDKKDISVRLKIGDLYIKLNNKEEAINQYKEVAKAHSQKGFYLKAIAVYKQILKVDETNFEMHYKLAELYAKQKLISDAIAEYSIIVNLFEKKGKTGEVQQLLKEMLEIDPDNISVRIKLAQFYQKQKFDKDALEEYATVFDKYIAQGIIDKPEKMYLSLMHTYPNHPVLLKGLAIISVKRGDALKFLKYAKPLLAVYKQINDPENAKALSEAILNIKPDDPDAMAYLGKDAKPKVVEKPEVMLETSELEEHDDGAPLVDIEEAHEELHAEPAEAHGSADESLIEFPTEETAVEGSTEESLIEFPTEETTAAGSTEESLIEFPTEETAAEGSSEESLVEFPTEETTAEGSSEESLVEFPTEETTAEGSSEESLVEFPTEETTAEGSSEESLIEFPAEETAAEGSSEESLIEFPTEETTAEGSTEESLIEFPAEEAPAEATSEESLIEFPAETQEPEAPVEAAKPEKSKAKKDVAVSKSEIDSAFSAAQSQVAEAEKHLDKDNLPKVSHEDLSKALTDIMDDVTEEDKISDKLIEEEIEAPAVEEEKGEFVDISSELGLEESLKGLGGGWGSAKAETPQKPKSAEEGTDSREDYETHLNLGIAYMEMEMHTEAVKELTFALKDKRLEFDAYNRLAMCYMRVNNYEDAIISYTKALKVPGRNDEERKAVMYELAMAYEGAKKLDDAGKLYSAILSIDPEYREVSRKVKQIVTDGPKIPIDDDRIEVEML